MNQAALAQSQVQRQPGVSRPPAYTAGGLEAASFHPSLDLTEGPRGSLEQIATHLELRVGQVLVRALEVQKAFLHEVAMGATATPAEVHEGVKGGSKLPTALAGQHLKEESLKLTAARTPASGAAAAALSFSPRLRAAYTQHGPSSHTARYEYAKYE